MALRGKKIEVCISVDDLPVHGLPHPVLSRLDTANLFLEALKKHSVKQAIGFVNGCLLETSHLGRFLRYIEKIENGNSILKFLADACFIDPKPYLNEPPASNFKENRQILEIWKDAGHFLGNHHYWHSNLDKTREELFIKGIELNTALLNEVGAPGAKLFRYPYLKEGKNRPRHDRIKRYLRTNGYVTVPTSVIFNDYAWNRAYLRSFINRSEREQERLKQKYLDIAVLMLKASVSTAYKLYGRDIKHILLLHAGAFTALMLDSLLTRYEEEGVHFIKLEDALAEEAYKEEIDIVLPEKGRSFLDLKLLSTNNYPSNRALLITGQPA